MIGRLYEKLAIPEACHLEQRVFKKLFYENAQLGAADRKAFKEDVELVTWQYTLKPSTIPVLPYTDNHREYLEVAVLQVDLRTPRHMGRIAEVIHRAIPYPLMVVFSHGTSCALSLAHKRFSLSERDAIVAEEFRTSGWIDLENPDAIEVAFLDSLAVPGLPHTHFLALYSGWVDRVIALDCARLSGVFRLESGAGGREERIARLAACRQLEDRISEYRAAIKKEVQFNRRVELNTKIKQLEAKLRQEAANL